MSAAENVTTSAAEKLQTANLWRRLRRTGCVLLLIIWFAALLLPCFLFYLATQQEVVVSQGDLPGQEIRIVLLMDAGKRGIGFWSTAATTNLEGDTCLITYVRYILWEGQGDPVSYCECYVRDTASSGWLPSGRTCLP